MNPELKLILGSGLVSLSLTYLWWTRLRVICLREDLFEIRDKLFDSAHAAEKLDDPAYKDTRHRLNTLIRFAHIWSFPVFAAVMVRPAAGQPRLKSDDSEFDIVIDDAIKGAAFKYVNYMLSCTLTGWCVRLVAVTVLPWVVIFAWFQKRVYSLMETQSDLPDDSMNYFA